MIYLDSSAIVKLVLPEAESAALRRELTEHRERCSSALARVEVMRAVRRAGAPGETLRRAEDTLERIVLIPLDEPILRAAATVGSGNLRSLDAIHLTTALSVDGVTAMATYDQRLAGAATVAGLPAIAPS